MTIWVAIRNHWAKWLFGFGFWTLIGLSFASQFYISSSKAGLEIPWTQAVSSALTDWYVFALLSIPVMQLARRFHFEAGKWGGSLAAHAVASVLFSLAFMVLRAWVAEWQGMPTFAEAFKPLLVKTWPAHILGHRSGATRIRLLPEVPGTRAARVRT